MANTFVYSLITPSLLAAGPDDDRLRLLELSDCRVIKAKMGFDKLRRG